MIYRLKRGVCLLSWRHFRWAIAIPTLPFVWWACVSHPLTQPTPSPEMQTDISILVAPVRDLDLVFMIDNSPSMGPKQTKMNDNFPKLIEALEDPLDGSLPNLHIAIIDSDLGTADAFKDDPYCGVRGIGQRYPSSFYGDMGHFQMINAKDCGVTSSDALFLEYDGNPVNFDPTILGPNKGISDVFACLAKGLGTLGCGEEHSLQAFEFALVPQLNIGNDVQQKAFLRPSAYLGLVFLSDEDDCSAATNDSMFGDIGTLNNSESPSLRCATRAHRCNGKKLTESPPGYPTTTPFETAFTECEARVDTDTDDSDRCPNRTDMLGEEDTNASVPTTCNPLKSIRHLANEIKSLKSNPDHILVAGIFGWPLADPNDPSVFERNKAAARYKIDKVANLNNTPDQKFPPIYDYWPVCYDPNHMPAAETTDSETGFDKTAAGFGATGGLRMSAFIDQFGEKNGLKFSICQTDFSDAMKQIGAAIVNTMNDLCVNYKLMDTDVNTDGLQPDCSVYYNRLVDKPDEPGKTRYKLDTDPLPECDSQYSASNLPPNEVGDCWTLTTDRKKCEKNGQLISVLRPKEATKDHPLAIGTMIDMHCRTCTDDIPGLDPNSPQYKRCHY
jgi:hypothetical protein